MRFSLLISAVLLFFCCGKEKGGAHPTDQTSEFLSAVDISSYPEIMETNPTFYDAANLPKDFLLILKENGVNTIRLRVWVNPANRHSGFDEVKEFSEALRSIGFKIWLTVHYSDKWSDPANQETPSRWQGLSFSALKDSVYSYTEKLITQINPAYIQIGNEINTGFLHPVGNIETNYLNFIELVKAGVLAVRQHSTECKIILHYAGLQHSNWFFDQVKTIDYDIIGLSYYPIWHGKSLMDLKSNLQQLSATFNKKVLIAETAYPFTLGWNDWTTNIVGESSQLILPAYPATPTGQKSFIQQLKKNIKETNNGIGFCYWGGELIAWKGNQSSTGSPWENQALFDFNNKALPVLQAFKEK